MRTHLQCQHPSIDLSQSGSKSTVGAPSKQSILDFGKKSMTTQQYQSITRKLALMCATDLKPISVVEGPGLNFFAHSLNRSYKMPCRKTVGKYLEKIYEEEKADLVETLSGHPLALTCDLWTSNALEGYRGLTGHFISKNWELYAKVLATRHVRNRHTGENIAQEIRNLIKEFKIDLCTGLVTENAANMSVAADKLGLRHVGCFAHTLQLAIEDGLKVPQIAKTLTVSRQLVSHFNHSLLATNRLLSKQTSTPKLKLVQHIQKRWNSSFYMLQRLLKLRVPIYTVIFDEAITKVGDRARLDIKDQSINQLSKCLISVSTEILNLRI